MSARILLLTFATIALTGTAACNVGGSAETRSPTTISLYPESPFVQLGDTVTLVGVPRASDGTPLNIQFPTTFSSSDAAKASVDSKTGIVTGHALGIAIITGTVGSGTHTLSATQEISVVGVSPPAVVIASASLAFTPSDVTITAGSTVRWQFESVMHTVTFFDQFQVGLFVPVNIGPTANAEVARTFAARGTYQYQCTIHPAMTGSITVN